MGILISKFRTKLSTRDTLEKIEQEIQNIEERKYDKTRREQFIVQILSFLPLTILIVNICILIYPSESTIREKLLLSVPIILLNLILWFCKKTIQWYSNWSLSNEETKLRKLQKEKKRILEMVCETESYKVATELLEKYDPKQLRRRERPSTSMIEQPLSPLNSTLTKISASRGRASLSTQQQHPLMSSQVLFHNQSLNLSQQPQSHQPQSPAPMQPATPISKPTMVMNNPTSMTKSQLNTTASSVQGRPVRPILNKDRSLIEKVVDWVVADGPDNRFALICKFCFGHNGMSLAEEFETINFRCCYCYNLNTAKEREKPVRASEQGEEERNTIKNSADVLENNNIIKESDSEAEKSKELLDEGEEEKESAKDLVGQSKLIGENPKVTMSKSTNFKEADVLPPPHNTKKQQKN